MLISGDIHVQQSLGGKQKLPSDQQVCRHVDERGSSNNSEFARVKLTQIEENVTLCKYIWFLSELSESFCNFALTILTHALCLAQSG